MDLIGKFKGYSKDFFSGEQIITFSTDFQIPPDALTALQNKDLKIVVKPNKKKRSNDANAYYWELCGQLARVMNEPALNIYRRHIKDMSNYQILCMGTDAYEAFDDMWCSNHHGRFTESRKSSLKGCVTVLAYYGSSDFDTAEMSRLIDNMIEDCHEAGISTITPKEVERLIQKWKA